MLLPEITTTTTTKKKKQNICNTVCKHCMSGNERKWLLRDGKKSGRAYSCPNLVFLESFQATGQGRGIKEGRDTLPTPPHRRVEATKLRVCRDRGGYSSQERSWEEKIGQGTLEICGVSPLRIQLSTYQCNIVLEILGSELWQEKSHLGRIWSKTLLFASNMNTYEQNLVDSTKQLLKTKMWV